MLYFASDIHAQYALFVELLEKIGFSSEDEMIICGDIIEKGPASIQLAQLVFRAPNIHCILGNHEYMFLKYYWSLMKESPNDFDEVLKKLQAYFPEDGHLLDWDTVDAFENLPPYIERDHFICVHAGLPLDETGRLATALQDVSVEQFVYDRHFKEPNVLPRDSKCVFFGHTPTSYLVGEDRILTYPRVASPRGVQDFYKVHLDTGAMISGMVGCICMDTGEEFYVRKKRY